MSNLQGHLAIGSRESRSSIRAPLPAWQAWYSFHAVGVSQPQNHDTHHNAGLCPFTNPSVRHFRTSKSSYKHVQIGLSRCKKRRQSLPVCCWDLMAKWFYMCFFAFVAKGLPVKTPAFSPNCRKINKAVCLREALSMIYLRWISWISASIGKSADKKNMVHLGTWQSNNRVHWKLQHFENHWKLLASFWVESLERWPPWQIYGDGLFGCRCCFLLWKFISVLAALALVSNGFAGTCDPSHAQRKLWLFCACP